MAADVGIDIENDKIVAAAMDNEIAFVIGRIVAQTTKDALVGVRL